MFASRAALTALTLVSAFGLVAPDGASAEKPSPAPAVAKKLKARLNQLAARDRRGDAKSVLGAARAALRVAEATKAKAGESEDAARKVTRWHRRTEAELTLARDLITLAAAKRRLQAQRARLLDQRRALANRRKTLQDKEDYLKLIRVSRK